MDEQPNQNRPAVLERLHEDSQALGFSLSSEPLVGTLLCTLAATKPGGHLLELGTGAGIGTAWLLQGMNQSSRLTTVENDLRMMEVAQRHLSGDGRVTFHLANGGEWLPNQEAASFDLIFADAWPGKYSHLEETLKLLKVGGLYVIDDMIPQANWPNDHAPKVEALVADLEKRDDLFLTKLNWSSGVIIATKRDAAETKCFHRSFEGR